MGRRTFWVEVNDEEVSEEGWEAITDQWLTELDESHDLSYTASVEGGIIHSEENE